MKPQSMLEYQILFLTLSRDAPDVLIQILILSSNFCSNHQKTLLNVKSSILDLLKNCLLYSLYYTARRTKYNRGLEILSNLICVS